jgi:hypothetical protein
MMMSENGEYSAADPDIIALWYSIGKPVFGRFAPTIPASTAASS